MNKRKISSLSLSYYTPVVILAAFLILPGVLGVIFINDTNNEFRDYVQNEQKVVTALNSLYANGLQMEQALRNIYINPADQKAVNSLEKAELNFADNLTIAHKLLSGIDGHERLKSNLQSIRVKSEKLSAVRKEVLSEIYNGNLQTARIIISENETPLWREVKSLILENLQLEEAVIEEKLGHVSGQTAFASQLLIWLLAGGFIAGLLIIWYNSRKFLKPVKRLGVAAERINEIEMTSGNGKLDLDAMVERLVQKFDLLNELANPVMIVDKDFTIQYMNQSGAQFLKTDQKSLLGEKCYDWFQTDQCNTEDCATHMAMTQNNKAANKTIAHGGGRDTHINYASIPLRDKAGNVTGALEAVADINDFAEKINTLISGIDDAVESNSSSSIQLSASAEELSQGAKQMSEQISDMASAIEEMSKTIFETAQNAEYAAEAAKKAGRIAKDGGDVIDRTIESMNSIAEAVQGAVKTVHQLAESSKQISKVAQVINEIADQTNLLALNATIEAASAGESGKGFAVVANEIRELAKRTMNSTGEIEEIINKIQSVSDTVITQIEKGAAEVRGGKEMADKAGLALDDIIEATNAALDIVNQVAAASEQQSAASEEISKNIENIENITQQTAAGISQVAASAEDLNQRNDNLKKLTSDIKI